MTKLQLVVMAGIIVVLMVMLHDIAREMRLRELEEYIIPLYHVEPHAEPQS